MVSSISELVPIGAYINEVFVQKAGFIEVEDDRLRSPAVKRSNIFVSNFECFGG